VPIPVKPDETVFPSDDFRKAVPGGIIPGWNIYSPRWAPVAVVADGGKRCLELRDGDPADYARAVRVFPAAACVRTELRLKPAQTDAHLEIELCDAAGCRPVRVTFTEKGQIQATDGARVVDVGAYATGVWLAMTLTTDLAAGTYTVQVNDGEERSLAVAEQNVRSVERLSLRTGPWRGCGDSPAADAKSDAPRARPAVFSLDGLTVRLLR
jgi:hypothetical protein